MGIISYVKYNPVITLTSVGANIDLQSFDVKTEVRDRARRYWEEHSAKGKSTVKPAVSSENEDEENESSGDELLDDFRTTRVVIQCKRFNTNPVSEPDINQFLGAMNKFQADYGVFITNGRFTNKARKAAKLDDFYSEE